MPLNYYEAFGVRPDHPNAKKAFQKKECPFVNELCHKRFANGLVSGSCTLINPTNKIPVPCCPKRLYGDGLRVLQDVVEKAWGPKIPLILDGVGIPATGKFVIPFGQGQGREIRIAHKSTKGSSKFSIDWVLALVDENQGLKEFVAVEVQTIDTTGNYRKQFWDLAKEFEPAIAKKMPAPPSASSSFNWENVNKRIIPQLITKGHILRREKLCKKGLFFICPTAVHEKILARVGELEDYPIQSGSITFLTYSIDEESSKSPKPLILDETTTTTTEQLSTAFASPKNLPEQGGYERAIRAALEKRLT
jgi:hypothetical protein